eukprot:CAMPEP_0117511734 /NCGR_PEP_ID=MMETSP0784-20121206/28661_1 /TAXON_ID=39447 /ORGANISM="" /LENGTH=41 /DNA_ID= /DNA_START= /DNA_END= /DNA_ORIENTATION=
MKKARAPMAKTSALGAASSLSTPGTTVDTRTSGAIHDGVPP